MAESYDEWVRRHDSMEEQVELENIRRLMEEHKKQEEKDYIFNVNKMLDDLSMNPFDHSEGLDKLDRYLEKNIHLNVFVKSSLMAKLLRLVEAELKEMNRLKMSDAPREEIEAQRAIYNKASRIADKQILLKNPGRVRERESVDRVREPGSAFGKRSTSAKKRKYFPKTKKGCNKRRMSWNKKSKRCKLSV